MANEKAGLGKRTLTTTQIDGLSSDGKPQSFLWDSKLSGFGVRVTAAGAKSFVLQTRISGKPARITIGSCAVWTIDEARKHARGLLVQIDQGIDPRETKAAEKPLEAIGERPLMDWWAQYLETGKPAKKQAFKPTYAMHLRQAAAQGGEVKKSGRGLTVQGPLFAILQTKLKDFDVYTLRDWFESELAVRPGQAVKSLTRTQTTQAGATKTAPYGRSHVVTVLAH